MSLLVSVCFSLTSPLVCRAYLSLAGAEAEGHVHSTLAAGHAPPASSPVATQSSERGSSGPCSDAQGGTPPRKATEPFSLLVPWSQVQLWPACQGGGALCKVCPTEGAWPHSPRARSARAVGRSCPSIFLPFDVAPSENQVQRDVLHLFQQLSEVKKDVL